ncbi:MAG: hypothetical protein U0M92_01030 [Bacilli bacterium]
MQYKKQIILSILTIFVLSALIIGATFAYFQAQGDTSSQTSATVKTYTTDVFSFETGDAISFSLNQENFTSGKGNQTGSTFAKTILTANNKTNTATEHYYLYLNISNNTFTYTQNENTPEILLTITDGTNPVTNITSLTYKTVTDGKGNTISGYDITNKKGLIEIFSNREITTTSTKTENWNITVTFINYNLDQSANAGHTFSGKVLIQKEKIKETVATVCSSGQTLSSCIIAMDGKDDTLYHHTSSLANGAGDNSYRYAGASDKVNNFVCFGSTTKPCPTDNLYRIIGVIDDKVKLIKYDYATSALLGTNGDYNDSYEPNIDYYKGSLSKVDTYFWNYKNNTTINNGNGSNIWSTSLLNKINLNTNYLNNIGTKWSNMIEDATWRVSGYSTESVTPSEMYTEEITNATKTYGPNDGTSKIGLVYASDYGFAASPSAWTTTLLDYSGNDANGTSITTINWMYMGFDEVTMTPFSSYSEFVFSLYADGQVSSDAAASSLCGSRPVLYLKASVTYAGGSGTKDSPITLVV